MQKSTNKQFRIKEKATVQLIIYLSLTIVLLFSACSTDKKQNKTEPIENTSNNVIMDTSYGQINFYDGVYRYSVYGKNNEVIEQGESIHSPKITLLNDSLLEFSLQTGTGLQTQWGFYYNFQQGIKSDKFTCVYDTFNENVVYGDIDKIVIRNIFDVNKYYYEIPLSTIPLSNTVIEPITDIKFADEGQIIKVTYYSDVDNSETTQELKLT